MTTTGTYGFNPSLGEIVLNAFSRIKIRGPAVTAEHMRNATQEANFMQMDWSNRGPNLWTVDLQTIYTTPGLATYPVPYETVMILDAYLTQYGPGPAPSSAIGSFVIGASGIGGSVTQNAGQNNRYLTPVSRTEYASYPNPTQQSPPTTYWFDRLVAPTITFYPTPDQIYPISYYRFRQIQDAALAGGTTMEIHQLWLDAAAAGLAHRLCRHYGTPQLEALRKADADVAYQHAADQGVERATFYIAPMIAGYYR